MRNAGTVDIPTPAVRLKFQWLRTDGLATGPAQDFDNIAPLAAGATRTFDSTSPSFSGIQPYLTNNVPVDARRLWIKVDRNDQISESNDANNTVEVERPLPVSPPAGTTTTTPTAPDIIVQSLTYNPAQLPPGTPMTFTGILTNQGNVNASQATIRFRIDRNNDGSWNFNPALTQVPIAAGASYTKTWTWSALLGNSKAELCITGVSPTEPNTTNNCQELLFTVK